MLLALSTNERSRQNLRSRRATADAVAQIKSGYCLLCILPVPGRNQFLDPGFLGCLRQFGGTFQNPQQVAVRVQACFPGTFNQTVQDSAALGIARCIAEQEVLPTHHKGLDAALSAVVGELWFTVLQTGSHCSRRWCSALPKAEFGVVGSILNSI